ncbi:hypothetical protein VTP01DRAFT_1493 [Rhizomucor pusillus]|uniref:uncharacterized protein n=1 Tax=Rhizomucor pusillus TaxID=4840 RepID=UPI003743ECF6
MSRIGLIFALHAALEGLLGLGLLIAPERFEPVLPLADPTAVLLARGYGAAVLGPAVASILAFNLPDMLPCKRALATGFMVFHAAVAFLFFQARKHGSLEYSLATTSMITHMLFLGGFYVWCKVTEGQVKSFTKQQRNAEKRQQ